MKGALGLDYASQSVRMCGFGRGTSASFCVEVVLAFTTVAASAICAYALHPAPAYLNTFEHTGLFQHSGEKRAYFDHTDKKRGYYII